MPSKLTKQQLKDVNDLLSSGKYRQVEIARKLNIDPPTINYYYKLHIGHKKVVQEGYFNINLYSKELVTI
jgi:Mn-dependent DtxR family transcriptional regulator